MRQGPTAWSPGIKVAPFADRLEETPLRGFAGPARRTAPGGGRPVRGASSYVGGEPVGGPSVFRSFQIVSTGQWRAQRCSARER